MAETLELLRQRTQARFETMQRHIGDLPTGRGGQWTELLQHVLAQFRNDIAVVDAQLERAVSLPAGAAADIRVNATQHLERVQALLGTLHFQMATYRSAVARSDVPVGLQHLIDVLMEDIVIERGDPIIHLDARNMYSTIDLTGPMNRLINALEPPHTFYAGPHPIVFNLPALDPNNVLLSPVLAHEVAHTAVNQRLWKDFTANLSASQIGADIQAKFATYATRATAERVAELQKRFARWTTELLCDAVAIALTGPSFLFAFAGFAVPSVSNPAGDTHPETHDRIRYALELVARIGWADIMQGWAPQLMAWLRALSEAPVLDHSVEETLLRQAMDDTEDLRRELAFSHIQHHFVPDGQEGRLEQAAEWLKQGVPLIDIEGVALTPWEAILAGWLAAIRAHGDDASTVAVAAGDLDFNAVIVKALEYSQIVSAWRTP